MYKRISIGLIVLFFFSAVTTAQRITIPSDARFNFNIKNDVRGLDFITRLRPVTYQFDFKKFERKILHTDLSFAVLNSGDEKITRVRRTGLLAQEVERAAIESGYNFNGVIKPSDKREHYSLSYEALVVPLVKAVQEQQEVITNQQFRIQEQDARMKSMEKDINSLNDKLNTLLALLDKEAEEKTVSK